MSSGPEIIVLCAGGHARVVLEILRHGGQKIAGLVDANTALHGTEIVGCPVLGSDDEILKRAPSEVVLVNALGNAPSIGKSDLDRRRALFDSFKAKGYAFLNVCSSTAVVAGEVEIGEGCQILTGAIIHPGCKLGDDAIINTGAQLDHDCKIGAHSHVAPGAILGGDVNVGEDVHIGAGAVIVQGVEIGDGAVVGAGAVVLSDVAKGATAVGNPARLMC
ncbi:MAG: acetyltransferase [Rhodospirillaceae bacterium]